MFTLSLKKSLFPFLIFLVCFSSDARVMPYSLQNSGLLSASHYYVRENTSTIRVFTLDGSSEVRVVSPEGNLCHPMMQPDDAGHLFFAGGPLKDSWKWKIYSANLDSGSVSLKTPHPIECYPLCIIPLGTQRGFLLAGMATGIELLPPGATAPKRIRGHEARSPSFDPGLGEVLWFESKAFEGDSDVFRVFRKTTLCRYDVHTGQTAQTPFSPRHIWSPAFWIGDSVHLGAQVFFELGLVNLLTQRESSTLCALDLKHGTVSELHRFHNDNLHLWEGCWLVVEDHSGNPSGQYSLRELPSFEERTRLDQPVHQMILGAAGNPILLTDESILIFDVTGKTCEKRYDLTQSKDVN